MKLIKLFPLALLRFALSARCEDVPDFCGQNGVCASTGLCQCDEFYRGEQCEERIQNAHFQSDSVSDVELALYFTALIMLFLLAFLVLYFVYRCYTKKERGLQRKVKVSYSLTQIPPANKRNPLRSSSSNLRHRRLTEETTPPLKKISQKSVERKSDEFHFYPGRECSSRFQSHHQSTSRLLKTQEEVGKKMKHDKE